MDLMPLNQVITVPSPTVQWGPWAVPLAAIPLIAFVIRGLGNSGGNNNQSNSSNSKGTQAPPPGWYDDPSGSGGQRWWDGSSWSSHTQGSGSPPAAPPRQPSASPTNSLPTKTPPVAPKLSPSKPYTGKATAFCVNCRSQMPLTRGTTSTRNGRTYVDGVCSSCGTRMSALMSFG
jgi:Protein of unknown function (DUF2510)